MVAASQARRAVRASAAPACCAGRGGTVVEKVAARARSCGKRDHKHRRCGRARRRLQRQLPKGFGAQSTLGAATAGLQCFGCTLQRCTCMLRSRPSARQERRGLAAPGCMPRRWRQRRRGAATAAQALPLRLCARGALGPRCKSSPPRLRLQALFGEGWCGPSTGFLCVAQSGISRLARRGRTSRAVPKAARSLQRTGGSCMRVSKTVSLTMRARRAP